VSIAMFDLESFIWQGTEMCVLYVKGEYNDMLSKRT
jgi:hypothetical protein